jgi:hypothetical protein
MRAEIRRIGFREVRARKCELTQQNAIREIGVPGNYEGRSTRRPACPPRQAGR